MKIGTSYWSQTRGLDALQPVVSAAGVSGVIASVTRASRGL